MYLGFAVDHRSPSLARSRFSIRFCGRGARAGKRREEVTRNARVAFVGYRTVSGPKVEIVKSRVAYVSNQSANSTRSQGEYRSPFDEQYILSVSCL